MDCKPALRSPPPTALHHYRHRAVATSDHRGTARGFLPRGLSNTCPQVCPMRRTVASHGQVSNKPKQSLPIAGPVCWRRSRHTASSKLRMPPAVIDRQQSRPSPDCPRGRPGTSGLPGHRIQPVAAFELLVQRWPLSGQRVGPLKEELARDGEELGRAGSGIGVDEA